MNIDSPLRLTPHGDGSSKMLIEHDRIIGCSSFGEEGGSNCNGGSIRKLWEEVNNRDLFSKWPPQRLDSPPPAEDDYLAHVERRSGDYLRREGSTTPLAFSSPEVVTPSPPISRISPTFSSASGAVETMQTTMAMMLPTAVPPPPLSAKNKLQKQNSKQPQKKKRKTRQVNWKKPKDMPRRPLSAYNLFFKDRREAIVRAAAFAAEEEIAATTVVDAASTAKDQSESSSPGAGKKTKKKKKKEKRVKSGVGFGNLARTIGAEWNAVDEITKAPYLERAASDKERYKKEMVVWRAKERRAKLAEIVKASEKDNKEEVEEKAGDNDKKDESCGDNDIDKEEEATDAVAADQVGSSDSKVTTSTTTTKTTATTKTATTKAEEATVAKAVCETSEHGSPGGERGTLEDKHIEIMLRKLSGGERDNSDRSRQRQQQQQRRSSSIRAAPSSVSLDCSSSSSSSDGTADSNTKQQQQQQQQQRPWRMQKLQGKPQPSPFSCGGTNKNARGVVSALDWSSVIKHLQKNPDLPRSSQSGQQQRHAPLSIFADKNTSGGFVRGLNGASAIGHEHQLHRQHRPDLPRSIGKQQRRFSDFAACSSNKLGDGRVGAVDSQGQQVVFVSNTTNQGQVSHHHNHFYLQEPLEGDELQQTQLQMQPRPRPSMSAVGRRNSWSGAVQQQHPPSHPNPRPGDRLLKRSASDRTGGWETPASSRFNGGGLGSFPNDDWSMSSGGMSSGGDLADMLSLDDFEPITYLPDGGDDAMRADNQELSLSSSKNVPSSLFGSRRRDDPMAL